MVRCQIKSCKYSKAVGQLNGTTFHCFPTDPVYREAWCQFIRLHFDPSFEIIIQRPRLCSAHFQDDDFIKSSLKSRYLEKTAIPRILHCPPSSEVETNISSHRVHEQVDSNVGNSHKNICRACLNASAGEHMFINGSEIAQMYTECTNLKAEPDDGLSQYICSICRVKLTMLSHFRRDCIHSYITLKKNQEETLEKTSCSDDTSNHHNEYSLPTLKGEVTADSENSEHEYSQSEGILKEISNLKDSEKDVQIIPSTEKGNPDKIIVKFGQKYQRTYPALRYLVNDMETGNLSELKETSDIFKEILKNKEITRKHGTQNLKENTEEHKDVFNVNFLALSNFHNYLKDETYATAKENDKTINGIPSDITCPICKMEFKENATFEEHLRSHKFKKIESMPPKLKMMGIKQPLKQIYLSPRITQSECRRVMKDREKSRRDSKSIHLNIPYKVSNTTGTMLRRASKSKRMNLRYRAPNATGTNASIENEICHICGKTVSPSNYRGEAKGRGQNCNETFYTAAEPESVGNNHILYCANEKQLACKVCGKKFNTPVSLSTHKIIHREKKLICDYCQKRFRGKGELKLHLKTHFGWRISCTMCSKAFSSHSTLAIHRRIHTGVRPYRCDVCEMGFISKEYLTRHKVTHSSERPHQCQYCGNKYKEKNSLRRHWKTQCKFKLST